MKNFAIDFTPEEADRLMKTGFVKIDDPDRGEIEVHMLFGENKLNGIGSYTQVNVIRSGSAMKVISE